MGYFCYNCVYFMEPSSCAIVSSEGSDVEGNSSMVIAPHIATIYYQIRRMVREYSLCFISPYPLTVIRDAVNVQAA
jgi:hypothetical protein